MLVDASASDAWLAELAAITSRAVRHLFMPGTALFGRKQKVCLCNLSQTKKKKKPLRLLVVFLSCSILCRPIQPTIQEDRNI